MLRICSWCLKSLGQDVEPLEDQSITHGICPDCMKAIQGQLVKHYGDDLEIDEGAGIYSKISYEFDERR